MNEPFDGDVYDVWIIMSNSQNFATFVFLY